MIQYLKYTVETIIASGISFYITILINVNGIPGLILKAVCGVFIGNLIYILLNLKNPELKI